jgi:hypothetical protein
MTKQPVIVPELDIDAWFLARGTKVSPNGRLERRIVANLIAHLEAKGFEVVGTWDGEAAEKVSSAKEAMEFIFNLDEVSLRVGRKGSGKDEHGILLIMGNGIDIVSDWNYYSTDRDGFNAAMEEFDAEEFA